MAVYIASFLLSLAYKSMYENSGSIKFIKFNKLQALKLFGHVSKMYSPLKYTYIAEESYYICLHKCSKESTFYPNILRFTVC